MKRLTVLRNTRKFWPPNRGWMGGFLHSLAPRPAALALLRNTRKFWPPNRGWTGGFLHSLASRPPALALLMILAAAAFAQSPPPGSLAPRTVYLLPMAGGLDQYLAQWLTQEHIMKVITDPKAADIVMTDRLGQTFEDRMAEIHPKEAKKLDDPVQHTFQSSYSRGTVFLVDAKTRQVLWSDYEKAPRSNSGSHLNDQAERIVKKLQLEQGPPRSWWALSR